MVGWREGEEAGAENAGWEWGRVPLIKGNLGVTGAAAGCPTLSRRSSSLKEREEREEKKNNKEEDEVKENGKLGFL